MAFGHVEPRHMRKGRLGFGRPHIGPDHAAAALDRIGFDPHRLGQPRTFRFCWRIRALAGHVKLPTMEQAPQPAFRIDPQGKRSAPMRAMFVEQADPSFAVAKGDKLFAEKLDPDWLSVVFGQFGFEQSRDPEAPHDIAHRGTRTGANEQFVVFVT